jgi:hypothetical protein
MIGVHGFRCCSSHLKNSYHVVLEASRKKRARVGKWIQNLAVAAVEVVLLSVLFLAIDVPEML